MRYLFDNIDSEKLMNSRSRCLIGVISSSGSEQFYSAASFQQTPVKSRVRKCHLDAMAVDRLVHFTVRALSLFMGVGLIGRPE